MGPLDFGNLEKGRARGDAAIQTLNVLDPPRDLHVHDGFNLVWVDFDSLV
jgi:hypothetical protein